MPVSVCCMSNKNSRGNELEKCNSLKEVFSLVHDSVKELMRQSRAGLDIGLRELGNSSSGVLSAFYPVGSNIIVINVTPIRRIMQTEPKLFRPYIFAVLLHEYLHSLGYIDEASTRKLSHAICRELFGDEHLATRISEDITKFFPYILYPGGHPAGNRMEVMEMEDVDYIG